MKLRKRIRRFIVHLVDDAARVTRHGLDAILLLGRELEIGRVRGKSVTRSDGLRARPPRPAAGGAPGQQRP